VVRVASSVARLPGCNCSVFYPQNIALRSGQALVVPFLVHSCPLDGPVFFRSVLPGFLFVFFLGLALFFSQLLYPLTVCARPRVAHLELPPQSAPKQFFKGGRLPLPYFRIKLNSPFPPATCSPPHPPLASVVLAHCETIKIDKGLGFVFKPLQCKTTG